MKMTLLILMSIFLGCNPDNNSKNTNIDTLNNQSKNMENLETSTREIDFNGNKVFVIIFDDSENKTSNDKNQINEILKNIDRENTENIETLRANFNDTSEEYGVKSYLMHHKKELAKKELSNLINVDSGNIENQLFNKLKLVGISFRTDETFGDFVNYNYSLGRELTQYVIVIRKNRTGKVTAINVES